MKWLKSKWFASPRNYMVINWRKVLLGGHICIRSQILQFHYSFQELQEICSVNHCHINWVFISILANHAPLFYFYQITHLPNFILFLPVVFKFPPKSKTSSASKLILKLACTAKSLCLCTIRMWETTKMTILGWNELKKLNFV